MPKGNGEEEEGRGSNSNRRKSASRFEPSRKHPKKASVMGQRTETEWKGREMSTSILSCSRRNCCRKEMFEHLLIVIQWTIE